MTHTMSAQGITWDLSTLYQGYDDPRIIADLDQLEQEAEEFASTYRHSIDVSGGPDLAHLRTALIRLEELYDRLGRATVYAALLFAADTSKPEHRNLQQKAEQRNTTIQNLLLFFELEWLKVDEHDAQRLSTHPDLAAYRHYLQSLRRYKSHTLTEAEERMVNEKDIVGAQAWQRYFTELLASLTFPVTRGGETQELDLEQTINLMRHADRSLRRHSFEVLYHVLGTQAQHLAYIYNTLMQDQITMNRLRRYPDAMSSRHLSNEIDPEAVDTMMSVVDQNYAIAQNYFCLKAKLLDLPRLQIYDQYAPVGEIPAQTTYTQARDVILEAMAGFDTRFHDIGSQFFAHNWIDAEVRPGKRGGAFCSGYPPSANSYILCSYTDDLRDVMTVAHELGHGIHFQLARKQTLFNFYPTLPMAETASIFAEMIVFEHLLNQQSDRQARLGLLCNKVEDIFATIFRQNVLTRFEQTVYAGRVNGRLTPEEINAYWSESNARYYGNAIEQTAGYERGWSYIPHFIYTPFYCYSYVFGNLLVLALYGMYREQGESFVPSYIKLLEAGGSQSPDDLLAPLGVNIRDGAFWQHGLNELRRLVDHIEGLVAA